MKFYTTLFAGALTALLTGCGGGGGDLASTNADGAWGYDANYTDPTAVTYSDPLMNTQWAWVKDENFYYAYGIDPEAHIHLTNFADLNGSGVTVAVIDDGLDLRNPDISVVRANNAVSTTPDTNVSKTDHMTHGTGTTGIVGARENGYGMKGIASGADIIFESIYDQSYGSSTAEAFVRAVQDAADAGADIISCSIGGIQNDVAVNIIKDLSVNGRNGKGIVFLFAAGNRGSEISQYFYAAMTEPIIVGATNIYNQKTGYSNFGATLDIVAPGGEYLGITATDPVGIEGNSDINHTYPGYSSVQFVGTSAATPIVAGVAALMLQANPNATAAQIQQVLKDTADKIGDQPYVNGRNDYYGYGKINADRAIAAIMGL